MGLIFRILGPKCILMILNSFGSTPKSSGIKSSRIVSTWQQLAIPSGIYLFKVNNQNNIIHVHIHLIHIPKRCYWRRSDVLIVNVEKISHNVLVFPWSFWCFYCYLWTYLTPFSSVSIVDFEQVNVSWVQTVACNIIIFIINMLF